MNSTKRTCITCTAKGVNKEEIPIWSKKDGLYSVLPKILNCDDKYNPEKQDLKEESPEIVGQKIEIPLEIKETEMWVFYWAAESGAALDGDKPEDPATSYGSESNRGLTKTDKDGNAVLILNCPKLYRENKQLYPRHVHYTMLTDEDVWSTKIRTLEIMCKLSLKTMKEIVKKKSYLIMNALSKESYDEKKIPNSILCHYESLDNLSKQKKDNIIKQLIKESFSDFPVVKEFVDSTESIKDTPIIVYCAHEECEASAKLVKHLYDCGYFNVLEFPGGLKEWFDDDDELFGDANSDEETVKDEADGDVDDDVDDVDDDVDDGDDETIELDTKLSDDEEEIVIDGIKYIHKLNEYNEIMLMEDREVIGHYDGEITWISNKEWNKHKKRVKEKGGYIKEEEGEVEEEEAEEEAGDEEGVEEGVEERVEEAEEEVEEEAGDEEEEKGGIGVDTKQISELKNLLDKMDLSKKNMSKKMSSKNYDLIDCLTKCKPLMSDIMYGGDTIYGGSLQTNMHRGWGFTFHN